MGTRKITTNQLKRIINEVLNEGFYYPIDSETQKKFNEVCKNIMYPHGSKEQLTEDQFIETLVNLGKSCYKDINTQNDMMIKLMGGDLYENKKNYRNLNELRRLVKQIMNENAIMSVSTGQNVVDYEFNDNESENLIVKYDDGTTEIFSCDWADVSGLEGLDYHASSSGGKGIMYFYNNDGSKVAEVETYHGGNPDDYETEFEEIIDIKNS